MGIARAFTVPRAVAPHSNGSSFTGVDFGFGPSTRLRSRIRKTMLRIANTYSVNVRYGPIVLSATVRHAGRLTAHASGSCDADQGCAWRCSTPTANNGHAA